MVKSFTFISLSLLLFLSSVSYAQTYYSQGDANFSVLTNWTENADGTGANPATIGNFNFIIQNGHVITQVTLVI